MFALRALHFLSTGVTLAWFAAWEWLTSTAPRAPDLPSGRIAPYWYKNCYIYLTHREYLIMDMMHMGLGFAVTISIITSVLIRRERNRTNPPGPQPTPPWPGKT
jgi:hypothetical protein